MVFQFRRKEAAWEVVDSKFVDPSLTYYGEEELAIDTISQKDIKGTYVFDNISHKASGVQEMQKAVAFSRQQLLREASNRGYNVLLIESWQLTVFQREKQRRVEVRYAGRPGRTLGDAPSNYGVNPPYIGILHT